MHYLLTVDMDILRCSAQRFTLIKLRAHLGIWTYRNAIFTNMWTYS
jgi:hypothetical protein